MEAFSIEELARTTDDAAVRRRFDRRNRYWLILLLLALAFITAILIPASIQSSNVPRQPILAMTSAVMDALLLLLIFDARRLNRPHRRALFFGATRLVHEHVTAVMIGWAIAQQILLVTFVHDREGWIGWAICFPMLMLAMRLIPAEAFLLFGSFFATDVVRALLSGLKTGSLIGTISGTAIVNLCVLGFVLFSSRRLRASVTQDWSHRRSQAREQLRMRDELQFARELQLLMLPEASPAVDWLDIASVSLPATEVGGDYFDYFDAGDGRVAIVSSDVAGHGLASGLVLSAFRGGFILLRDSLANPSHVLTRLDDLVAQTSRRRMLVTAAILLLDRNDHRAVIASAGHPPVLFRRADAVEAIEIFAPPLGTRLRWTVPRRELAIETGDVFVLHTDGLYETTNESGDVYGLDRLANIIRISDASSAESLRDAIVRDVEQFRGSAEQTDDITVVVVKVG
ncbi:MAG TPA: PP2C family protein-serine/threonine phosphatase [Thermoanaerobaculia bacterium]|nr:PP2C family protein-serine/threonine phosphatase [Thermoanaerobaculia bacterium]